MKDLKQQLRNCKNCKSLTLHYKNGKKINWVMHIFLMIVTAGLWIIPFLLIVLLGMTIWDENPWVCSKCAMRS